MHKLSIITPVYNGKRFIEFCIRSVIEQNCPEVEHVIVDGGSTDGTVEIIRNYANNYSHIRWFSEKDRGQSDAMNKGIAIAQGAVLGFLNVDDYYEAGTLNRIVTLFRTLDEPTLAVGNCHVWREDGSLWFVSAPRKLCWKKILAGRYREAFPMNSSGYFYHRSLHNLIGPYDPDDHYSLDVDFILRALMHVRSVYLDEHWGNYRYLPGTKTFEDDMSGGNAVRLAALRARYLRNLPPFDRLVIVADNLCMRVISRLRGYL
ncbi:glycosyltransferase family 2 protein, partial [Geobacter anodireducens]|uniref:glycosyltransferase family 2 protein n=1 Tax=Geobacter soli TaxID=1510391 RepID=UPI00057FB9C6